MAGRATETSARAIGHFKPLRRMAGLAYRGHTVQCPACGARFRKFFSQLNDQCWDCGALARHRQIALLFSARDELLRPDMAILHVAPEAAVRPLLPEAAAYTAGDLEPRKGMQQLDVTDIAFPDASFDAVICNHVMEHVPEDRAALREIARVLVPGGWAILMTPILVDQTDEDPSVTDPAERARRWGQSDHVRRYGWDYVDRLEQAGLEVEVVRDHPPEVVRRHGLNNRQAFVEPLFLAWRPGA